jgi:hypothetical protein
MRPNELTGSNRVFYRRARYWVFSKIQIFQSRTGDGLKPFISDFVFPKGPLTRHAAAASTTRRSAQACE